MRTQIATASRLFHAPAETLYSILADYRNGHPQILPKPYFISLEVEEGGFGRGTIVRFQMRLLGQTQSFRSLITEPEPGRVLVETDIKSGMPTTFIVEPAGDGRQTWVRIGTELEVRNAVEGFIAKAILQKVYRQELELLAKLSENPAGRMESKETKSLNSTSSH